MKSLSATLAVVFAVCAWASGIGTIITTVLFFFSFFADFIDVSWYHPLIGVGCYVSSWVATGITSACLVVSLEK